MQAARHSAERASLTPPPRPPRPAPPAPRPAHPLARSRPPPHGFCPASGMRQRGPPPCSHPCCRPAAGHSSCAGSGRCCYWRCCRWRPLPSQPGSGHARPTVSKGRGASGCRLLCMQHRAPTLVAAAGARFRLGAMRLPRLERICSSTSSLGRGCCDQSLAVRVPWARSFAMRGVLEGRARKLLCKRTMGRGFCLTSSPRRYTRYEGLGLLETGPKLITQCTICRVNEVEI